MKILHIIKSLGRGGAEMLLPETLRLHDHRTFEFHYIYFLPWKNQMVSAIVDCGGTVTCIPANNNVQLLFRTRSVVKYIREHKINLIHAHLPWAGVVARLAGKLTGVPVLYTEHNKQERYHFATRRLNLATMNWLTEVIAVSGDVESSIRKFKPRLTSPLKTILNGVNTDRFAPGFFDATDIRGSLGIPATAPVVGTVAVFRFQKRLDLWIETASAIRAQVPEAHFIVVGDGPLKDQLEAKRISLGMEHCLHFAGLQTEVRPYYAAFDIFMMSSIFEGLPIALLEAMSMECAIVSTDAGGIKEVIRDGQDGLLCSVDNPGMLVTHTVDLLKDNAKRLALSGQARSRVVAEFSLQKMVAELENTYSELVPPIA